MVVEKMNHDAFHTQHTTITLILLLLIPKVSRTRDVDDSKCGKHQHVLAYNVSP